MCRGYELAVFVKNQELIDFCEDKIAKRAHEVLTTDAFLRCENSALKRFLELYTKRFG